MAGKNKSRVGVLFGGRSGEHEVSLMSALSVLRALDTSQFDIVPIGCDKEGQWYLSSFEEVIKEDALQVRGRASKAVTLEPALFQSLDVIFPVMHGPLYEDGCLQGFLELCDVAYVGAGPLGSALAMDKAFSKQIANLHGVNTAEFICLSRQDNSAEVYKTVLDKLEFPMFVKPVCLGSSVGINRVLDEKALQKAIEEAFYYDDKVMVESGVSGRELEISVLETKDSIEASVAGEIVVETGDGFYSYEAKYLDKEAAKLIIPADLEPSQLAKMQSIAKKMFTCLGCEGLARVDFFIDKKTNAILFNELNTLPGFTEISMYPKLWAASGLPYSDLLTTLIESALKRHQRKKTLVRDYS